MAKKTLIVKKATVNNLAPKRRGRPPKIKEAIQTKSFLQEQIDELKKLEQKSVELRARQDELSKILNETLVQDTSKLQEKLDVSLKKYRTKYMQLEHERRQWQKTKDNLIDIISKLKSELIKYAPDSELFSVADKVTEIVNGKHVGGKRSLKMPE